VANRDPKRARKKDARDERAAALAAQLRRRRAARIAGILAFVAVLAILIGSSLSDDKNDAASQQTPTPQRKTGEACAQAEDVPEADPEQYEAPEDVLQEGVDYAAVVRTSCGDIEIDLLEEKAPENANSFAFLAREGFYDGLLFHRVERGFVIQAGDPNGQNGVEPDGPGYMLPDELPDQPSEYVFGVVGMANAGPDTGGSQFFIITYEAPEDVESQAAGLPRQFTIFGEVAESSYETIKKIDVQPTRGAGDPAEASMPVDPIYILGIDIVER